MVRAWLVVPAKVVVSGWAVVAGWLVVDADVVPGVGLPVSGAVEVEKVLVVGERSLTPVTVVPGAVGVVLTVVDTDVVVVTTVGKQKNMVCKALYHEIHLVSLK